MTRGKGEARAQRGCRAVEARASVGRTAGPGGQARGEGTRRGGGGGAHARHRAATGGHLAGRFLPRADRYPAITLHRTWINFIARRSITNVLILKFQSKFTHRQTLGPTNTSRVIPYVTWQRERSIMTATYAPLYTLHA